MKGYGTDEEVRNVVHSITNSLQIMWDNHGNLWANRGVALNWTVGYIQDDLKNAIPQFWGLSLDLRHTSIWDAKLTPKWLVHGIYIYKNNIYIYIYIQYILMGYLMYPLVPSNVLENLPFRLAPEARLGVISSQQGLWRWVCHITG